MSGGDCDVLWTASRGSDSDPENWYEGDRLKMRTRGDLTLYDGQAKKWEGGCGKHDSILRFSRTSTGREIKGMDKVIYMGNNRKKKNRITRDWWINANGSEKDDC